MLEVVLAVSLVPGAAPVLPLVLGPALDRGGHGDTGELQRVVQHLLATPVHRASRGQTLDNYPPTVSHHKANDSLVSRNNRPSARTNDPSARTNGPSVRGM